MNKNCFIRWSILALLLLVSQISLAGVISPVAQLNQVSNRMLVSLRNNKSQLHKMSVIRRIVNRVLIPNIDLNRMSLSVVGRYWRTATGAQRSQFKREFTYLVTTTYASALSSYDDDRVRFYPLRQNYANRRTMLVRSMIIRRTGQKIPISYNVIRHGSRWKVYDFSIENVSMVRSYRSQFSSVLSSQGFVGLLARLKRHNSRTT